MGQEEEIQQAIEADTSIYVCEKCKNEFTRKEVLWKLNANFSIATPGVRQSEKGHPACPKCERIHFFGFDVKEDVENAQEA